MGFTVASLHLVLDLSFSYSFYCCCSSADMFNTTAWCTDLLDKLLRSDYPMSLMFNIGYCEGTSRLPMSAAVILLSTNSSC